MERVLPDRARSAASLGTAALLAAAALVGCTAPAPEADAPATSTSATPTPSTASRTAAPGPSTGGGARQEPRRRFGPVSLPAFFDKRYDGRGLALHSTIATTDAYTSYSVTYRSN